MGGGTRKCGVARVGDQRQKSESEEAFPVCAKNSNPITNINLALREGLTIWLRLAFKP